MSFLLDYCTFQELTPELVEECENFTCQKDKDIEQFFLNEYAEYAKQLLGKSYCFVKDEDGKRKIACAFTVANSSIKVDNLPNNKRNKLNRKIPHAKRRSQYPAVLVGQLAVFDEFKGLHIGDEVMDFIKAWFIDPLNKTGCRYIIVDAVNHEKVIDYYNNNGFNFIFSSDQEEIKYMTHSADKISFWRKMQYSIFPHKNPNNIFRKTRLMFFDLIVLYSKA